MRKTTKILIGGSKTRIVKGKITEITGGNHKIWALNGSIINNAGGQINSTAKKNHVFGDYKPPEEVYISHPTVQKVEFFDENSQLLNQNTKEFFYGKKLKIKVTTKDAKDGTIIFVKLKGKTKSKNQPFDLMSPNRNYNWWAQTVTNNQFETNFFELNPNWYSDDFEYYDYNDHITKIKEEDLNEFFAEVNFDGKLVYWPLAGERLKPIAYKRNYEELIGLFNTDNSGTKDLIENYENKFINSIKIFKNIVDDFSAYIYEDNCDITIDQINIEVLKCAKKLWDEAVWQNKGYNLTTNNKNIETGEENAVITTVQPILDDRPLYWSRIAMQVILKRHPAFYDDIKTLEQKDQDDFFIKSIVPKKSKLWKTIEIFEEQSRNYTNIDFSKAGNKKKVLITGFDPFVLNDDPKMPENIRFGNPSQSNPSGINALALHGKTIGGYFIQTLICPVRYKDFDEFKEEKGIIETFIQPFLQVVDLIITVSQGGAFRFDVDRFPCKNRGGFMDNMLWGKSADGFNETYFKQLIDGKEFYETTLPYAKIVPIQNNPSDTFWTYFNQTFTAIGDKNEKNEIGGTKLVKKLSEIQTLKSIKGSGSNYLSNEIFYRVSKMRTEQVPNLQTGHLHIPMIQEKPSYSYERGNSSTEDINPKIKELVEQIKKIISKI